MKKIIKIDVEKQDIYHVELSDNYKHIYDLIGNNCSMFCVPVQFDNGDVLYADDESLLRDDVKGGFIMPGWSTPILGNALVVGSNEEGESVDCLTTIDDMKKLVRFIPLDDCLLYQARVMRNPNTFYKF